MSPVGKNCRHSQTHFFVKHLKGCDVDPLLGNVNDWFGKLTNSLLSTVSRREEMPSNLPHPHNAGLIPAKPAADNSKVVTPRRKVNYRLCRQFYCL